MQSDKMIWVLEDEETSVFVYKQILDIRYRTRYFENLEEFTLAIKNLNGQDVPSLVIADLGLKDGNFINFLSSNLDIRLLVIPFLIVSSSRDIDSLRFCFQKGAVDYLTKPFNKNELLVKLERFLNEEKETRNRHFTFSAKDQVLEIDEIIKPLGLTRTEKSLLQALMFSPDYRAGRQELIQEIWGDTSVQEKTLDVHVSNLRKKLVKIKLNINLERSGYYELARL